MAQPAPPENLFRTLLSGTIHYEVYGIIGSITLLWKRDPAVSGKLRVRATAETDPHRRSRQCVRNAPSRPLYLRCLRNTRSAVSLKAMSRWLDGQRALISLVADDLRRQEVRETGRRGLPAESVLRCALLKQQRQLCYEERAFHLEDSASFRAFARLPLAWSPKKSVLHHTIAAIRAETWEAVN